MIFCVVTLSYHTIYCPGSKNNLRKIAIIFLSISLNMCFGCSKEWSHRDGSFEYPQHMFWLRNKDGLLCGHIDLSHNILPWKGRENLHMVKLEIQECFQWVEVQNKKKLELSENLTIAPLQCFACSKRPEFHRILSGNIILTSIKGHNSYKFAKNDSLQSQRRSCQY